MVNIINQPQRPTSLKSQFAEQLGQGVGGGLQDLLQNLMSSQQNHPAQSVFNEMAEMLAQDKPGIGIDWWTKIGGNRQGVENRAKFNSMRGRMESILLPMVNKGNLSNTRFNFIMEQIPKASDSQRAIAGKLQGLAAALSEEGVKIDPSALLDVPFESEEIDKIGNKKGKKNTFDIFNPEHVKERNKILRKAKGNRDVAEKILLRKFDIPENRPKIIEKKDLGPITPEDIMQRVS